MKMQKRRFDRTSDEYTSMLRFKHSPAWARCLEYWHNCCAVCGRPASDEFRLVADHWIPFALGGWIVPSNIVPLCHPKKGSRGGCNLQKWQFTPEEFLMRKFGNEELVHKKLVEIQTYFRWVKEQDTNQD